MWGRRLISGIFIHEVAMMLAHKTFACRALGTDKISPPTAMPFDSPPEPSTRTLREEFLRFQCHILSHQYVQRVPH